MNHTIREQQALRGIGQHKPQPGRSGIMDVLIVAGAAAWVLVWFWFVLVVTFQWGS